MLKTNFLFKLNDEACYDKNNIKSAQTLNVNIGKSNPLPNNSKAANDLETNFFKKFLSTGLNNF
jgi:hypothetical protein